jgi:gas vesicle protein
VREIVGFVMGAAAGAAGALFVSSTEGRALLERLKEEARPEAERAATEWEPVLREVGRAVRLAVRELETATVDLRARIGEIAADRPDEEVALAMTDVVPGAAAEAAEAVAAIETPDLVGEAAIDPAAAAVEPAAAPIEPAATPADVADEPASTT